MDYFWASDEVYGDKGNDTQWDNLLLFMISKLVSDFHPQTLGLVGNFGKKFVAALAAADIQVFHRKDLSESGDGGDSWPCPFDLLLFHGDLSLVRGTLTACSQRLILIPEEGQKKAGFLAEDLFHEFSKAGYYGIPSLDVSYFSPNALYLGKEENTASQTAAAYEVGFYTLSQRSKQLQTALYREQAMLQQNEAKKEEEIRRLKNEISKRDAIIASKDNHISNITNARGYRILSKLYRLKDKLLPRGSRRFKIVRFIVKSPKYFVKGIRHIFRHGFKGLWTKIKAVLGGSAAGHISEKQKKQLMAYSTEIQPIKSVEKAQPHTASVDVIICVHNAYEDVKKCIASVYQFTSKPYHLIIVDDGSAPETRDFLADVAKKDPDVHLIRNEQGNGYTIAANMGLKASTGDYCMLLNSDTIVTEGWLDKMIQCATSDEKIGVVGPLSNTASWQSVPQLTEDGDWCHNELPQGFTVADMGELIEKYSADIFMKVPLINGFCMLVSRKVIDKIGYLDDITFSKGFGEEDDFNLRAYKAGFVHAIADNAYVFHAQSKSYSDEKRMELCATSGQKLKNKHGEDFLNECVRFMGQNLVMEGIRSRARIMTQRKELIDSARRQWSGKKILFILPTDEAGGGGNVVIQEALKMKEMGVEITIYNLIRSKELFEKSYPNLEFPVLYGENLGDFVKYAADFDVICSTLFSSVKYCSFPNMENPPICAYYIQDFEPYFFEEKNENYYEAFNSYTIIPDMKKVTKTNWNRNKVKEETGAECCIIGPSVNVDLFRPRKPIMNDEVITICAMVRPHSPRRGPRMTMEVFAHIARKYKNKVNLVIFGCDPVTSKGDRDFFDSVDTDFKFKNAGKISPEKVAAILSTSDIFVDFSTFQAMGLTAMEAMSSGCAVVMTKHGGTGDFVRDESNCLVIDTLDKQQCIHALERLIDDYDLRTRLAMNGISDMCEYFPEKCAYNFLEAVFESEND